MATTNDGALVATVADPIWIAAVVTRPAGPYRILNSVAPVKSFLYR